MFLNNARFTLDKDTFEDEKIDLFIYFIRIQGRLRERNRIRFSVELQRETYQKCILIDNNDLKKSTDNFIENEKSKTFNKYRFATHYIQHLDG